MNILGEIIRQMSNEDIRSYKIYAKRSSESADRKDIKLFEAYRKSAEPNDDEIANKIYGKTIDKNTYHRLKNRLVEEINKSAALGSFDDPETEPYYLLSLHKYYYGRNRYNLAQHFLKKAKKSAMEIEDFELLDIVYSHGINLSRSIPEMNPESILEKTKINNERLSLKKKIDEKSAVLSYRIRSTQNFAVSRPEELELYEQTVKSAADSGDLMELGTLKLRVLKLKCQLLILRSNFSELASFLIQNYPAIKSIKAFAAVDREMKTEMFIYLINALNAEKKLTEAVQYASDLKAELTDSGKVLYEKYVYFVYQALVNAYSELKNHRKALEVLEEADELNIAAINPTYEIFTLMNSAICRYELGEYSKAAKTIGRLYLSKAYKGIDPALKLKIEAAELIIRYEKGDLDFLEYRIGQFLKDRKLDALSPEFYLAEILKLMVSGSTATSVKLKDLFQKLKHSEEESGKSLIDYIAWLKVKLKM